MTFYTVCRGAMIAAASLSLSACLGSSGGSSGGGSGTGGGGAPSMSAFDAKIADIQTTPPSSVKLTGAFDYAGETLLKTQDDTGSDNGFVLGDVTARLDFDSETATAEVGNLRGEVDGTAFALTGTLDTDNAVGGTIGAATTTVPGVGDITTTAVSLNVEGTLSNEATSDTADVTLLLGGSVLGNDARAVTGAAVAAGTSLNGKLGLQNFGGGQFYLEKK
ncbi:hypothetical protein ABMC89_14845 [Sulfitobacter sp. HNIBRBA3233]|uniref:hypothetical protein n=1 Tax=Sulfitobacter marinivivus TaxID=3158558 RepID=UPI0032DEE730